MNLKLSSDQYKLTRTTKYYITESNKLFTMINNITELLEKFDKINFDTVENKQFSKGEWNLRYHLEMGEMFGLQILFRLYYRKHCVQTWGCIDEDNVEAIRWIKRTERNIREVEDRLDLNARKIGKELFNEL